MTSAGLLTVRANWWGGALEDIGVELKRPLVTQLFIGQIPDAVVKAIPYLYTLCAHAQRAVAQAALAAAMGEARRPVDDAELWTEMLHENFWRLLLDWPAALGLPPAREAFAVWRAARQTNDCLAETRRLLATSVRELSEKCLAALVDRSNQAFPLLEAGTRTHGSAAAMAAAAHACRQGVPADFLMLAPEEWLTYWLGNTDRPPAMPRPSSVHEALLARLAQTEWAAQALAAGRPYPVAAVGERGWGVAQTVTARGVLTHAVHVVEERVENYRVWAPTDDFFADAGALSSLLAGRQFAVLDNARQALEQAILALDPCLPYTMDLKHA